jgi:hypothetical protein
MKLQARLAGVSGFNSFLSLWPRASLAESQKSECARREARGRGGLGAVKSERNEFARIETNGTWPPRGRRNFWKLPRPQEFGPQEFEGNRTRTAAP